MLKRNKLNIKLGFFLEEKLVNISNLSKYFSNGKRCAIEKLDISFSEGKIIGLIGPDGAGKTTLIRIMAGLLKPTTGNVTILGNDTIEDPEKVHQSIGYMPQRFGLYEDLTVEQNLNLYADIFNLTKEDKEKRFEVLLKFTNLKEFTKRLAGNLSGGMKQKLGLACTLLRKPRLLLLDEPSVGVDPLSRRELWQMVVDLKQDNITVLWSTSYLDEAEKCDEVIVLNEGKLLYNGKPLDLTSQLKGKTFQIQNILEDRRRVLRNVLKDPGVVDGVIQGSSVRVVMKKDSNSTIDLQKLNAGEGATLAEVEPRFEDAFMEILGGGPKEESPLMHLMKESPKDNKPIVEVKNLVKQFGKFFSGFRQVQD